MQPNLIIDQALAEKVQANDLNAVDCFRLSIGETLCKLFPEIPVFLIPQQQTKPIMQTPPAIFVSILPNIRRMKRFNDDAEWEIAVNVAYMSEDANAETEQLDAAVTIMDGIELVLPIEGINHPFKLYDTTQTTVDGIVNITGITTATERRLDDSPIIEFAQTNVYTKEE